MATAITFNHKLNEKEVRDRGALVVLTHDSLSLPELKHPGFPRKLDEYGTTRYLFVPPEGFEVPFGSYFGGTDSDGTEYPELMALIRYLGVDYEPEKNEIIDVEIPDATVYEPTLAELQKLLSEEDVIAA